MKKTGLKQLLLRKIIFITFLDDRLLKSPEKKNLIS